MGSYMASKASVCDRRDACGEFTKKGYTKGVCRIRWVESGEATRQLRMPRFVQLKSPHTRALLAVGAGSPPKNRLPCRRQTTSGGLGRAELL